MAPADLVVVAAAVIIFNVELNVQAIYDVVRKPISLVVAVRERDD